MGKTADEEQRMTICQMGDAAGMERPVVGYTKSRGSSDRSRVGPDIVIWRIRRAVPVTGHAGSEPRFPVGVVLPAVLPVLTA